MFQYLVVDKQGKTGTQQQQQQQQQAPSNLNTSRLPNFKGK